MDEVEGLGGKPDQLRLRPGNLCLASPAPRRQITYLRISRHVLEHYPAFVVLYHLDQCRVAQAIRARPEARLVVVQNGAKVSLMELLGTDEDPG